MERSVICGIDCIISITFMSCLTQNTGDSIHSFISEAGNAGTSIAGGGKFLHGHLSHLGHNCVVLFLAPGC